MPSHQTAKPAVAHRLVAHRVVAHGLVAHSGERPAATAHAAMHTPWAALQGKVATMRPGKVIVVGASATNLNFYLSNLYFTFTKAIRTLSYAYSKFNSKKWSIFNKTIIILFV